MKKLFIAILLTPIITLSCDESNNISESDQIDISFNITVASGASSTDINLYAFDENGEISTHLYYDALENLESERLTLDKGNYTFIIVMNTDSKLIHPLFKSTSEPLMISDFIVWLKDTEAQYPNMLTGLVRQEVSSAGGITIDVAAGISSLSPTILRLNLTLANGTLPDYTTKTKASSVFNRRAVVEVYRQGTEKLIHSYSKILDNATLDLTLQSGEYDILLWVDYTPNSSLDDYYYSTTSLKNVTFSASLPYTACTPNRDALYLFFPATVTEDSITETDITLKRPFAKYRIIATDIERYNAIRDINNHPPVEELEISINYEGYFRSTLNIATEKITNSANGINYQTSLREITTTTATICDDYVFVTESDSSVDATIIITDANGEKIAQIPNVKIEYRQNHLTTISGDFLTAGLSSGGVSIDTDWDGEFNVEF